MQTEPSIEILADATALANRAAQLVLECGLKSTSSKETFSFGLSGGNTPKVLYQLLASPANEFRNQFPWTQTHFFWTDERHVGPDSPDSNYRMVHEAMLSHVPVPEENIHRIRGELRNAEHAAADYEKELKRAFGNLPKLDLVLLGMGPDGHTASIFPGSEVLNERDQLVVAPWVDQLSTYRLTMTLRILNNAAAVLLLVSGEEKAEMLQQVLRGAANQFPVQLIQPTDGSLTWLVDSAAASKL